MIFCDRVAALVIWNDNGGRLVPPPPQKLSSLSLSQPLTLLWPPMLVGWIDGLIRKKSLKG